MIDNGVMTLIIILVVVSLIAFFCLGYLYARVKINRIIDREVMKRIEKDFINNLNNINKNNNIKNVKVKRIDVNNLEEFEEMMKSMIEELENEENKNDKK